MTHRDLVALLMHRHALQQRVRVLADEAREGSRAMDLPFTVEVDDLAVTVKKPQYHDGVPQVDIKPIRWRWP